jgi:apolipoprotein D and lipocalin family protein
MTRKILSTIVLVTTSILGCTGIPDNLKPVDDFEADRYLGKWYEIARLDHSFEKYLSNVSATYMRAENDQILVLNKGYNVKTGEWKQIEGHARFIKEDTKLKGINP